MRRNKTTLFFAAAAAALLTLTFAAAVHSFSRSGGESFAMAREGTVRETVFVRGLFIYDETVVTTAENGTFTAEAADGDLVAAGERCGALRRLSDLFSDPVKEIAAPCSGLFFRRTDGWEAILTRERVASLDPAAVFRLYAPAEGEPASFLRAGDDCFKLIDPKKDVFFLADIGAMVVARGDTADLVIGGEDLRGGIEAVYGAEGRRFALIRLTPSEVCYASRAAEAGWVLQRRRGTVIDAAAVTERRGEIGVYCEKKGKRTFCPVSVLCSDGKNCVVLGINPGEFVFFSKS
ncbi:MAG: hypothetical protein ACOX8R_07700 [Bacillota bacterium]